MSESVFDQNTNPPVVPPVSSDPFADKLTAIVNGQGQPKYKDIPTALEALKASQEHIKRLEDERKAQEQEAERLREAAIKAEALEDIVQRLTKNSNSTPSQEKTPPNTGMNEEATLKLLENVLTKKETESRQAQNLKNVSDAIVAKFGEKSKEVLAAKAQELGMTLEGLKAISRENPKVALTLFGLTQSGGGSASPTVPTSTPLSKPKEGIEVKPPEKSLLSGPGATDAARRAKMAEIKKAVYARFNVEE